LLDANKAIAVSPLVLAECYCTFFRIRYRQQKGSRATADAIKADIQFQKKCHPELDDFFGFIERFVKLGRIRIIDNAATARAPALDAVKDIPLLPYDALHYASMRIAGIKAIATVDRDFTAITDQDITIFSLRA